jgi:ubiquinone/menaquinone biosynthesis C-methylase UbiE
MERTEGVSELLDGPLDADLLVGNLRDLQRVNRWLGGSDLSWQAVQHVTRGLPDADAVSLLDVGTGAGDIPVALLGRARAEGRRLEVKATDVRAEILAAVERRLVVQEPTISLALVTAGRIDEPDSSFDVVHASLVLHHLELPEARQMLAEMARVARLAVIVNDLDRGRRWWLGAWLLSRVATGNPYTRNDAPLSVRRAYRPAEITALASHAGLREVARFRSFPAYRYAIVLA